MCAASSSVTFTNLWKGHGMPPKIARKFGRFDASETNSTSLNETRNSASVTENNLKKEKIENDEMKPIEINQTSPTVTTSPSSEMSVTEEPLDFSFKRIISNNSSQTVKRPKKRQQNGDLKHGNNVAKPFRTPVAFPDMPVSGINDMVNENNSSPTVSRDNGSPGCSNSSGASHVCHASPTASIKNSDPPEMACSQSSNGSGLHFSNSRNEVNGEGSRNRSPRCSRTSIENIPENYRSALERYLATQTHTDFNFLVPPARRSGENSPDNQGSALERYLTTRPHIDTNFQAPSASVSRENSPDNYGSALQRCLATRSHIDPNFHTSSALASGCGPLVGLPSPMFNSLSPPVAGAGPFLHTANGIIPISIPYFGYNFPNPQHPYLSPTFQPTEPSAAGPSDARKQKNRKNERFANPLRSCSVDELKNKLNKLRGESSSITSTVSGFMPLYTSNEPATVVSTSHSPEHVQSTVNPATTGTGDAPNAPCGNDTNDRVSSAITETPKQEIPPEGRKRKAIPESEKDEGYRTRREKNNIAAKKSRETRRIKEGLVVQTNVVLESKMMSYEHENELLKMQLKESQRQMQSLATTLNSIEAQNSMLVEKFKQKRCGQCGAALSIVTCYSM